MNSVTNEQVDKYIAYLDEHFIGHTIIEYFDETLIMLKRKLCWQFKDIIYFALRNVTYSYKEKTYSAETVNNFEGWSAGDVYFYK